MSNTSDFARFWANVSDRTRGDGTNCWEWTGYRDRKGYGQFYANGRNQTAYRWFFEYAMAGGTIPPGYEIDHLCSNPPCVRLSHLEMVTHHENIMRSRNFVAAYAKRTHCKNGHPFEGDNLIIRNGGARRCRTCVKEINRISVQKRMPYILVKQREYRARRRHAEAERAE